MIREVVLDTETTGLNPEKGDRIIEIGALELFDHVPTGKFFHVYLNPERKIPEESIRIHKITDNFVADKPLFSDVVHDFLSFLESSSLVIHNAEFDIKFLQYELQKINLPMLDLQVIDTLLLARGKYPGSSVSLDALCKRFNVDTTNRKERGHGALTDSILLSEVYLEMLGGKQPNLGFDRRKTFAMEDDNDLCSKGIQPIRPKLLTKRISQFDIKKHQEFLKTIGCDKAWKNLKLHQVLS